MNKVVCKQCWKEFEKWENHNKSLWNLCSFKCRQEKYYMKILCLIWIHIYVKDFFSTRMDISKSLNNNDTALIRQCMICKKVINKPNFKL